MDGLLRSVQTNFLRRFSPKLQASRPINPNITEFCRIGNTRGNGGGSRVGVGWKGLQALVGEDWQHVAEVISGVIFPDRVLSP